MNLPHPPPAAPRSLPVAACLALLILAAAAGCTTTSQPDQPASTPHPTQAPQNAASPAAPPTPAPPSPSLPPRPFPPLQPGETRPLFDGKTLDGWAVADFAGRGEISIANGELQIGMGAMLSGVTWTNSVPHWDFEISLEAKRVEGNDFFCGLTVPVGDSHCSLIVGGWGGGVVGISSLDGQDASENESTSYRAFERNRWYQIRLRVTHKKIQAWIDQDQLVDVAIEGRRISLRVGEIDLCRPLGIATWQTTAALRNIRLTALPAGS